MADKATAEMLKNAVVVEASEKHTATIIFFHGLGDTGDGWCFVLNQNKKSHVKLICPTASKMPVSVNSGYVMPSWFDIHGLEIASKQDEEGIKSAAVKVHELLDAEQQTTGIPSNRIILGGISQGASLAIYSALTYKKPLAGIVALSTWIPVQSVLEENMTEENKEVPFLHCHGDKDRTVKIEWGTLVSQFVQSFNKSHYDYQVYPGLGHWFCPEELTYIENWMDKCLPSTG